jgi:hypothetical protein
MKDVPWNYTTVIEGNRQFAKWDWYEAPGVVYLMLSAGTGEYKVGGSINPLPRLRLLKSMTRRQLGLELGYVWSTITNGVGRLEACWREEWRPYKVPDTRRDWFLLPDAEVRRFRSFALVTWKDYPPVPDDHKDFLTPPDPKTVVGSPPGVKWVRPKGCPHCKATKGKKT